MPRVTSIHPRQSLRTTLSCRPIMFPCNPFRSNTSTILRKCSFQKNYINVKYFRSNTYKKTRGALFTQSVFGEGPPVYPDVEGPLSSVDVPLLHPLSSRWSPVVFQREMPSISFLFIALSASFHSNEGGGTLPPPSLLYAVLRFPALGQFMPGDRP